MKCLKKIMAAVLSAVIIFQSGGATAFAGETISPPGASVSARESEPKAADSVTYLDYDPVGAKWQEKTKAVGEYTEVKSDDTEWSDGWYVVSGAAIIQKRINVEGDVHLILKDGCDLHADLGINVSQGNSLTIYGQTVPVADAASIWYIPKTTNATGKLIARTQDEAAIGGNSSISAAKAGEDGGAITINGGFVDARSERGVGIGGGFGWKNGGAGGTITINGGLVNASSGYGAGIGGGNGGYFKPEDSNGGAGGTVTINGGLVSASSVYGAGIGGGSGGKGDNKKGDNKKGDNGGSGGTVTISGGTVVARSKNGVGIGGGCGINKGDNGTFSTGTAGSAVLIASSIADESNRDKWSGLIFESLEYEEKGQKIKSSGTVYGNPTLALDATIYEGMTLTVPENATLTVGTETMLTLNGEMTLDGKLAINGKLTLGGKLTLNGKLTNHGTLTSTGSGGIMPEENRLPQAAPAAPAVISVTDTSVVLGAVAEGKTTVKYAYATGSEEAGSIPADRWTDSTTFSGLEPATLYTFYARYEANGIYLASISSGTAQYTAPAASGDGSSSSGGGSVNPGGGSSSSGGGSVNPGGGSSSSGGGSVNPGGGSTGKVTTDKDSQSKAATTTAPTEVKVESGTASATVRAENVAQAIRQAEENKSTQIVFAVSEKDAGNADMIRLTISRADLRQLLSKTEADLVVKTPAGDVILSQDTLEQVLLAAEGADLTVGVARVTEPTRAQRQAAGDGGCIVEVTLESQNKAITTPGGSALTIGLEIPAALLGKKVAAIRIPADGETEKLTGKTVTRGTKQYYEFAVTHPSTFALVDAATLEEAAYPQKGEQLTDSRTGMVYKVTKAGATGGTVQLAKAKDTRAKTITIPDKVTFDGITYKVTSIAAGALKNNKEATRVVIGKNVTVIGAEAFSGCTKLKSVTIGKGVVSINSKAFYNCTSLTTLTLPASVTKIWDYAFKGCSKLSTLKINSTKLTTKTLAGLSMKGISTKTVIKVPKSKVKAYKTLFVKKGLNKKVVVKSL
ncbi:MAG: leucine-rich repeat domain-containing protein [Acetivibrio ethanolgignens]